MYKAPDRFYSELGYLYDPVIDQLELPVGKQIEVKQIEAFPRVLAAGVKGKAIHKDTGVLEEWASPPSMQDCDVFVELAPAAKEEWIVDWTAIPDAWIAPSCVYDFVTKEFVPHPEGIFVFGGLYDTLNWRSPTCSCGRFYTRVADNLIAITGHQSPCRYASTDAVWQPDGQLVLRSSARVLVAPTPTS